MGIKNSFLFVSSFLPLFLYTKPLRRDVTLHCKSPGDITQDHFANVFIHLFTHLLIGVPVHLNYFLSNHIYY